MAQTVALKDPKAGADTALGTGIQGLSIVPQSIGDVVMFADRMADSRFVPPHLRGKPGDCFAVAMQAFRWRMDPFAVASKSYFVNDRMAYEAQMVNAVVLAHAPIIGRPKIAWGGAWPNRTCTVTGHFSGDSEPKARTVHAVNITTRNSPLWKTDPDQQLAYYATRAWARLYCPDVLMGVYTPDDDDMRAEQARDVTPPKEEAPSVASRLDAMERAIAGEPPPEVMHVNPHTGEVTDDDGNPFGFPESDKVGGGTQPNLAPEVDALKGRKEAEASRDHCIQRIKGFTSAAEIDAWTRRYKATINAMPEDLSAEVWNAATDRIEALSTQA